MKQKLIVALLSLVMCATSFAQSEEKEISLFEKEGNAVAYIAKDLTIYIWDGDPVAYISESNGSSHVYGFNGTHLGWYIKGVVYNNDGFIMGAQKDALRMSTLLQPEPAYKGFKNIKPLKSFKEFAPFKPILSDNWSATPLVSFLEAGVH